jgi:hypothetical protein
MTHAAETSRPAPLVIQDQGSFAVGGTVITNPGKFEPYKPTAEGQTLHGITPMSSSNPSG